MCCEDVKIAFAKHGEFVTKQLTTSSLEFLSGNPHRIAIVLFAPSGSAVLSIGVDTPAVSGQGIQMSSATFPVTLSRDDIGDAIAKPWYALSSVNGAYFSIIEVSLFPGGPCGEPNEQQPDQIYPATGVGYGASGGGPQQPDPFV